MENVFILAVYYRVVIYRVQFVDAAGQFGANNCVVSVSNTSTYKIANLNETLNLNVPNQPLELMWSGSTYGWVLLNT